MRVEMEVATEFSFHIVTDYWKRKRAGSMHWLLIGNGN